MFYWIWGPIIARHIDKSREVMLPYVILSRFPHGSSVELISAMVRIPMLKWVHDDVVIYLVVINLASHWKTSMEFRHGRTNFSNSDIVRKKAIQGCVNSFQAIVVERRNKVCHLKSWSQIFKSIYITSDCSILNELEERGPDPRRELLHRSYLHQLLGDPCALAL